MVRTASARVTTLLSGSPLLAPSIWFHDLGISPTWPLEVQVRTVHCPPGPQSSWTDGIVQDYHRFMIVTADNENEMRRWITWILTDVLIGKLVG